MCITRDDTSIAIKQCKGLASQLFYIDDNGFTRSHLDGSCLRRDGNELIVSTKCHPHLNKDAKTLKYEHGLIKNEGVRTTLTSFREHTMYCLKAMTVGHNNLELRFGSDCPQIHRVTQDELNRKEYEGVEAGKYVMPKGKLHFVFKKNHMM